LTGSRFHRYEAQVEALKAMGCAAVITVMHTGEEYSYEPPSPHQRQVAERAAACGSALVIGHHPHVVQGFTTVSGMPVVYSLGNCSFGGTTRAKDSAALAVQAVLCFEEGELRKTELHFHPISMTSDPKYNNYSPRLLEGEEAERVLRKMEKSTGNAPGPWSEEDGAVNVWPAAD
jgi:poly-gamma-glutamate synthesis protein (capsule biosynthesis protein)